MKTDNEPKQTAICVTSEAMTAEVMAEARKGIIEIITANVDVCLREKALTALVGLTQVCAPESTTIMNCNVSFKNGAIEDEPPTITGE
ncbi:MAG: hypothetical protein JKY52_08460 [Flavobacteriales bacterium]|nr:hypothetical protein [Flavobacteriales bacterium]